MQLVLDGIGQGWLQAVMALAIAVTALPMLWPVRSRAQRRRQATPPPQRAAPAPGSMAPTISPEAAFTRVAAYIDKSGERVRNVHGATLAASRQIDNAEMALLRLIREAAPYMTMPSASLHQPT